MAFIEKRPLPDNALLLTYQKNGDYTDCYTTDIPRVVSHADYVAAFYTTSLFKLERFILKWVASKPSSDSEARQLADREIDEFAAWYVEGRGENQLLLCDFRDRTRSWLMVSTLPGGTGTRLYFGSAVVRTSSMGSGFSALLGFHKLYSRALLYSTKSRLQSQST